MQSPIHLYIHSKYQSYVNCARTPVLVHEILQVAASPAKSPIHCRAQLDQLVGFRRWVVPVKVAKIQWTDVRLVPYGCKILRLASAVFHSSLSNLDPRICHGSKL